MMSRVMNEYNPLVIQEVFKLREGRYNLRGLLMFSTSAARTNVKYRGVSVSGVKYWNRL